MADRRNMSRLCILFKIVTGDMTYSNPPCSDAKIVTTSRGAGTPHSLLLALPGPPALNTHIFLEYSQDGTR